MYSHVLHFSLFDLVHDQFTSTPPFVIYLLEGNEKEQRGPVTGPRYKRSPEEQPKPRQQKEKELSLLKHNMAIVLVLFIFFHILREVTIGRNMDNFRSYTHSSICFYAINLSVCAFHLYHVIESKKDGETTYQHKKGLLRALCVANISAMGQYVALMVFYELYKCQQNHSASNHSCIAGVYSSLIGQTADQLNLVSFCCAPS